MRAGRSLERHAAIKLINESLNYKVHVVAFHVILVNLHKKLQYRTLPNILFICRLFYYDYETTVSLTQKITSFQRLDFCLCRSH